MTNPLADENGGPFRPVDLGHPDANRAINAARAELDMSEPRWWWLLFDDPDEHVFLGAAAVKAPNMLMASQEAWRLGCNPGGQMVGCELPPGVEVPLDQRERLLDDPEAAEVAALLRDHPAHGDVGEETDDQAFCCSGDAIVVEILQSFRYCDAHRDGTTSIIESISPDEIGPVIRHLAQELERLCQVRDTQAEIIRGLHDGLRTDEEPGA